MSSRLLPRSALAQAIAYASNQWQALRRYTEDGQLTTDNNAWERRLRDQAIRLRPGGGQRAPRGNLGRLRGGLASIGPANGEAATQEFSIGAGSGKA
jgi:Transposase IS66 family